MAKDFDVINAIQIHLSNYLEFMEMLNRKDLSEEDIAKIVRSANLAATGGTFLTQIALLSYVQSSAQAVMEEEQKGSHFSNDDNTLQSLGNMWK